MALTDRQKIIHLLRRFGYGASGPELKKYIGLGVEGTISKLLSVQPEPTYPHPFQFFFEKEGDAQVQGGRVSLYWLSRALISDSPLRDRLALFWHDHFAVDDEEISDSISTAHYVDLLRKDGLGKFDELLLAMAKEPAFMDMLDIRTLKRGAPNENFARELLELYTFGIGNYTEKDIQEIARALTGYTFVSTYYDSQASNKIKLKEMLRTQAPYTAFAWVPEFHDPTEKEFLGYKGKYNPEQTIKILARDARCAKFICVKLWEHFAYPSPETEVVQRLTKVFTESKGSILSVVECIMRTPQFYSVRAFSQRVKSPFDFVIGMERCLQLDQFLRPLMRHQPFDEPVDKEVGYKVGSVHYQMSQMGMALLFAPSVDGWTWGPGWVSTDSMLNRMKYSGVYTWTKVAEKKWDPVDGLLTLTRALTGTVSQGAAATANEFLEYLDVSHASPVLRQTITERFANDKLAEKDERGQAWCYTLAIRILVASPEFHLH